MTNISLTCVGCGVTAEFINSQDAYSPKKGKFEFHICGILTCTDISFFLGRNKERLGAAVYQITFEIKCGFVLGFRTRTSQLEEF